MYWARRWKGKKFIQGFDKEVERNGQLGRHRHRYQRYIKIGLKVVGLKSVKRICLTQNWCLLRVVMNTIMTLWFIQKLENSLFLAS
jgi:hypothetical protein